VQSVARLASRIAVVVPGDETVLVSAAYLHDIGYAPELALTGFHPLDGARFLRTAGHERHARLVAHHTNARGEALLRGITDYEEEFPFEDSLVTRAVTYCDFSTDPEGKPVSLEMRVAEIVERYGSEHVTARAIAAGVPEFEEIRAEIDARLAAVGVAV
jgi:hypothetical protein